LEGSQAIPCFISQYKLTKEQQKEFRDNKSIKPDIVLQDLHGNILAVFENKLEDEKSFA